MRTNQHYLLDNTQNGADQRLRALAELFDPTTFNRIRLLGIQPGWTCWEAGAGGPTVATWLAEQVGPTGQVLATDIEVNHLLTNPTAGFQIQHHDLANDPIPTPNPSSPGFDLVHARLVLTHIPQREQALRNLVRALRPGGVILIQEADPTLQPLLCLEERTQTQRLANRLKNDFRELLHSRGADLSYGRTLPRRLRELGLNQVSADAYFPITGPACADLERATIHQVGPQLLAAGLATQRELDTHLAAVDAGELDLTVSPLICAWGRKPAVAASRQIA
jgi:SAM-dependent methyltransferase